MSVEDARKFCERIASDSEFLFFIAAIEDIEQRMAVIHSKGFDCTFDEISEVCGWTRWAEVNGR